jgi:predicted HD phosphohydrolase
VSGAPRPTQTDPIETLDALLGVLEASAALDDEEAVDLLAHALQCAQRLREVAPADVELQVAGLVHDVGTALVPHAPDRHARIGADALRPLLGARIARLVGGHADAKRYLVAVDPSYTSTLSARSVATLAAQGGPLNAIAAAAFTRRRDAQALIALRKADDEAKVAAAIAPGLDTWHSAINDVIRAQRV